MSTLYTGPILMYRGTQAALEADPRQLLEGQIAIEYDGSTAKIKVGKLGGGTYAEGIYIGGAAGGGEDPRITAAKISNWDTAYGWGNHANAGYASASAVSSALENYAPLAGATFSGAVNVNANFAVDTNTLFVDAVNNRVGLGVSTPLYVVDMLQTAGQINAIVSTIAQTTGNSFFAGYDTGSIRRGFVFGVRSTGAGFIQNIDGNTGYSFEMQPFGGGVIFGNFSGAASATVSISRSVSNVNFWSKAWNITDVPAILQGAFNQQVNLLEIKSHTGTNLYSFGPSESRIFVRDHYHLFSNARHFVSSTWSLQLDGVGERLRFRSAGYASIEFTASNNIGVPSFRIYDLNPARDMFNIGQYNYSYTDVRMMIGRDDSWNNLPTASIDIKSASTAAKAALRIRPGVDPNTPNDGDMWYDGTNLKFRQGTTTINIV